MFSSISTYLPTSFILNRLAHYFPLKSTTIAVNSSSVPRSQPHVEQHLFLYYELTPQCLTERRFRLSPCSPSWWASSFLSTALNTILWRNIFLLLNPEVLLFPTIFLLSLLSWLDFCKSYIYYLHFLSVFSILALKSSLPIY